jgi:hypothetical protein
MYVLNGERPFPESQTLLYIREFILEKSPTYVLYVEKPSIKSHNLLYTREFI